MKRSILLLLFGLAATLAALAQTPPAAMKDSTEVPLMLQTGTTTYKGRTVPHVIYPVLPKYPPLVFKSKKEREQYNRLVFNIKKVLPWAKLAKLIILETYEFVEHEPDPKKREAHFAQVEADLKRQYAPALKRFSRSQGKLLVKLVNRECNETGYNITKAFLGSFKANLYQSVAVLFGNSLNKKYDPEGDDRYTERVVRMVEAGVI